jgi:hypothetical protein
MTMLNACFRAFEGDEGRIHANRVFDIIKGMSIRFSPPENCLVQNTFMKVLDPFEAKKGGGEKEREIADAKQSRSYPFKRTIVYREFCYFDNTELKVALDVAGLGVLDEALLTRLGRHINCIGKRGSFWQYVGEIKHAGELPADYTQPLDPDASLADDLPWTHDLDDFGDALCKAKDGFDRVSTYGEKDVVLGKHRVLVRTAVPYRFVKSSSRFTQFKKTQQDADNGRIGESN